MFVWYVFSGSALEETVVTLFAVCGCVQHVAQLEVARCVGLYVIRGENVHDWGSDTGRKHTDA